MSEKSVGVPLAFLLALAPLGTDSSAAAPQDTSDLLKPGSLRGVLKQDQLAAASSVRGVEDQSSKRQIAQWFSCFQGFWRRC